MLHVYLLLFWLLGFHLLIFVCGVFQKSIASPIPKVAGSARIIKRGGSGGGGGYSSSPAERQSIDVEKDPSETA
jgi:hypothetical protein